ncbi:MAG TPA: AtpZ/AtpI family protein [Chitinophagales bacterium]|nr:AtpZ/AtpI family protein [Chitinophagales bacterium]
MTRRPDEKKAFNSWVRYSAIGTEMFAAVFIGAFGGMKIDEWMGNESPIATVVLLLLGLGAAFYLVYKQIK